MQSILKVIGIFVGVILIFVLAFVDEIASIELVQEGDALNYQVYEVASTNREDWLQLWLPHEFGDAERFADAIEARIATSESVDPQYD